MSRRMLKAMTKENETKTTPNTSVSVVRTEKPHTKNPNIELTGLVVEKTSIVPQEIPEHTLTAVI